MQLEGANKNIHSFVRVKHVDYEIKMLETEGDKEILIKDTYQKTPVNQQSFTFDKVYNEYTTNEEIFDYTYKNIISKAFDNINCSMICTGVNGSGKSFTLFSDDFRSLKAPKMTTNTEPQGMVYQTVKSILQQASDLEDTRQLELTASFYDQDLDKLRDQGSGIPLNDGDMGRKLTMVGRQDTSNRFAELGSNTPELEIVDDPSYNNISLYGLNTIIRNGTVVPINTIKDIERLLEHGFSYRERSNVKIDDKNTDSRAHLILNLCLKMTDDDNPNFPQVNSLIQFVKLGGSEKVSKSLNDNNAEKYQENIILNSDYACIQRLIYALYAGQKSVPYDGSKLTKALRQTVASNTSIILLACLNPNEANFEDSLITLTHLERCKYFELQNSKNEINNLNATDISSINQPNSINRGTNKDQTNVSSLHNRPKTQDNIVQQLQSEINDLKIKTEALEKDYKIKFQSLGVSLGIDDDIEKLLYMKKDKKWMELNDQRKATDRHANLMTVNKELENKLNDLRNKYDHLHDELEKKENDYDRQIADLDNEIRKKKDFQERKNIKIKEQKVDAAENISRDLKSAAFNSKNLLEEKVAPINNLPLLIDKKTSILRAKQTSQNLGIEEANKIFCEKLVVVNKAQQNSQEDIKLQFEALMKKKAEDEYEISKNYEKYFIKKKSYIKEARMELINLYECIIRQNEIVTKVEQGVYNSGIKGVNIPIKEKRKIVLPSREKFVELYKSIEKSKYLFSQKTQGVENQKAKESYLKQWHNSKTTSKETTNGFTLTKTQAKEQMQREQEEKWKPIVDQTKDNVPYEKIIEKLSKRDLEVQSADLLAKWKFGTKKEDECMKTISGLEAIKKETGVTDLKLVKEDIHKYKRLYEDELKKSKDSRVRIEKQKKTIQHFGHSVTDFKEKSRSFNL